MIFLIESSPENSQKWIDGFGNGQNIHVIKQDSCQNCTLPQKIAKAYEQFPDQAFYCLIKDTQIPITDNWFFALTNAVYEDGVAYGNDNYYGPNMVTAPVIGSGFAKKHGLCHPLFDDDNLWCAITDLAKGLGQARYVQDVIFADSPRTNTHSQRKEYINWKRTEFREYLKTYGVTIPPIIMVAMPTNGWVTAEFADFKARQQKKRDYIVYWERCFSVPHDTTRNMLSKAFLESDADYLLMMDNDVEPHPQLLEMAKNDKPICAAHVNYIHNENGQNVVTIAAGILNGQDKGKNVYKNEDILKSTEGLMEVDAVGTGCIMIRRDVLESMEAPYFSFRRTNEGFLELTEDYEFCERAKSMGYSIWVDKRYYCPHRKETVI